MWTIDLFKYFQVTRFHHHANRWRCEMRKRKTKSSATIDGNAQFLSLKDRLHKLKIYETFALSCFWVNGVGALLIQRQDNAVRTYSGVSAPSQMLEQTPKVCPWPLPGAQMFRQVQSVSSVCCTQFSSLVHNLTSSQCRALPASTGIQPHAVSTL